MSKKLLYCVCVTILCRFAVVVICCTNYTFESTRITALRNIVLDDKEITDATFFTNINTDFVVPVRRITGCITPANNFEDVVAIQIRNERVPIMREGAVQNLESLHSLYVISCGVTVLKPKAFQYLPSITVMKISDNIINSIPSNVFNNLMVKVLILKFNSISYIASDAFNDMPRLEIIDLSGNNLSTWNSDWLSNCPRVVYVVVKFNSLTSLPPRAFRNIEEKLQRIYLSYNNINHISPRTFTGLHRLTDLSLAKNNLTELDDSTFLYLENLKVIDLSQTSINCLSDILLNSLRPDVLLWIDKIPLKETCREGLKKWAKETNNALTFFNSLIEFTTTTTPKPRIRF